MSSLAPSIFHKHSLYEFPRPGLLLSPPDTDFELGSYMQPTPISRSTSAMLGELDHTVPKPCQAEPPAAKFGRVSTLAYHHSGPREPQERSTLKTSKSLVVIIPPENFSQEHGQLGHTLSSGPRNRLSHGILMPLFPTMYAQLTAIAREFNFPSTLGLCLYLQISDSGITATPRISDDSWHFLWGHFLDGSNPVTGPHRLPISGRIEFDIDLGKARWYTSWIAATRRDTMLSHAPSMSHSLGDSRTLFVDEQVNDEQQKNPSVIQPTQNLFRHVPKKLSLLSKPASRSGTVSPEVLETQIVSALSPIIQDAEPPTAKQKLETRVNNWRANTSLAPTYGSEIGDLKAVSVNNHPVTPAEHAGQELNLDDFTWSISSAGPPSEEPDSPLSCERLPSIHLDRRIGSVCLTPSVCTSFGPFDSELHSPMTDVSRLPSPDIAHRMVDDCPPTPTTATSWGAPLSYPPSPLSEYRPPSIHMDRRGEFSRPVSPATATSWGAPMSWPVTPLSEYRAPSVDMGERSGWSRPVTPSTATTFQIHTPDAEQRGFDSYDIASSCAWNHVWPYRLDQSHFDSIPVMPQKADDFQYANSTSSYPHLVIYPAVYPYYDLYPAVAASEVEDMPIKSLPTMLQTTYPVLDIYPACYPHFDIYPVAYPCDDLYPAVAASEVKVILNKSLPTMLQTTYPVLDIYPAYYPHFDIYPVAYPCDDLYPAVAASEEVILNKSLPTMLQTTYPVLDIYPACYPHFDIYPVAYPCSDLYLAVAASEVEAISNKSLPTMLQAAYPVLDIYPACYPHFDIYPVVHWEVNTAVVKPAAIQPSHAVKSTLPNYPSYPDCNLHLDVSPSPAVEEVLPVPSVKLTVEYPYFDLYPAVYPFVTPYPSHDSPNINIRLASPWPELDTDELEVKPVYKSLSVILETNYPTFNIYPAVYPAFEIYPSVPKLDVSFGRPDCILPSPSKNCSFPDLDTHPAISPRAEDTSNEMLHGTHADILGYPVLDIYPAVYPYLEPYPAWWADVEQSTRRMG